MGFGERICLLGRRMVVIRRRMDFEVRSRSRKGEEGISAHTFIH